MNQINNFLNIDPFEVVEENGDTIIIYINDNKITDVIKIAPLIHQEGSRKEYRIEIHVPNQQKDIFYTDTNFILLNNSEIKSTDEKLLRTYKLHIYKESKVDDLLADIWQNFIYKEINLK